MTTWLLYLLPIISAALGWIIARISISAYISVLLKQKPKLTTAIGAYADAQISLDAIEQQLVNPSSIEKLLPVAEEHIDTFLRIKLPIAMPMLAMFISDKLVAEMKAVFMTELKELFPVLIQQYFSNVKKSISVSHLISDRLNAIADDSIRALLTKHLQVITVACAATGFLCGCLYILLTWIA